MKKSWILIILTLCLTICMSVCAFAEGDADAEAPEETKYLPLSSGKSFTPGWWFDQPQHVAGWFAEAFTSPSNFSGIAIALYCGTDAPAKISLLPYTDSLQDTVYDGTELWTVTQSVTGDHPGNSDSSYLVLDFGMVVPAGRYVIKVEYGEDEIADKRHVVVGAANALEEDTEDLDIELDYETAGCSVGNNPDAVLNARLILTDAEADPLPSAEPTAEPTEAPTEAPATDAPTEKPATEPPATPTYNPPEEEGGCGSLIGGSAALLGAMTVALFVFRKRR